MPTRQPENLRKTSSIILPADLNHHPINSEKISKMKPKIKVNCRCKTFKLIINLLGYEKEDINVYAGNGKVAVKAIDRMRYKKLNVCKVYKAEYKLPDGAIIEKLRKSFTDGVLCIRGKLE